MALGFALLAFFLLGPIIVLAVWLWLSSRREPPYLAEPLDIGRVFAGTFSVFGSGNLPLWGFAIVTLGGARVLTMLFHYAWLGSIVAQRSTSPFPDQEWVPVVVGIILATILSLFFEIPALLYLVRKMEGEPVGFGTAARMIPRSFLPLLGLQIVTTVAAMFASMLFVLPGIILWLTWLVAMPAMLVERLGIFGAMRRSRDLTVGSRGRILLLVILFGLLVGIVMWSVSMLVTKQATDMVALPIIIYAAASVLTGTLRVSMYASLYVELRRIREGGAVPSLAEVFA